MLASSTLLTLADGRFPAGGHAHSAGLEEAVASGRVASASDLAGFLAGQLQTKGASTPPWPPSAVGFRLPWTTFCPCRRKPSPAHLRRRSAGPAERKDGVC